MEMERSLTFATAQILFLVCVHMWGLLFYLYSRVLKMVNKNNQPQEQIGNSHFGDFFQAAPEPEPGNNYLIFRFYPEPQRLMVSLFRARQNKSGLSKVQNPVTLEQIINNPDWCEVSPELPNVALQIGQYLDYLGHKVEIPAAHHLVFVDY